jgi:A/G-specific adenine glycosylase
LAVADVVGKGRSRYFRKRLLAWFAEHSRDFPWRMTSDPYRLLMAEVLLQRTQAPQVRDHYAAVLSRFPQPQALAAAPVGVVAETIRPLGLAKRAPLLKRLGEDLSSRFQGNVPADADELASLPGVGRYIAGATACFAFELPTAVVDVNAIRVFSRFFGVTSRRSRPREDAGIWAFAQTLVPPRRAVDYNRALIDFASLVCRPRNPVCTQCPLQRRCLFRANTKKARKED